MPYGDGAAVVASAGLCLGDDAGDELLCLLAPWTFPVTLDTRCLRCEGVSLLVPLPDLQWGQVAPVRMLP